jgi:hypothetical protein
MERGHRPVYAGDVDGTSGRWAVVTGPAAGSAAWIAMLIGLGTIPAVILAGPLTLVGERLIEVPLLLVGCVWIWLGRTMLSCASQTPGG